MIKKILFLSVIISQLTISCSKDETDPTTDSTEKNLEEQIAEIAKLPYSSLTQDQQKVKLETEANATLVQLDQMKTSPAIDATDNLETLLSIDPIDILDDTSDDQVAEILNVSEAYGIYTWDRTKQIWVKTPSATELKFIFPAKENQLTNNASFTANSTSSGIKVDYDDQDQLELPSSVNATLIIDGKEAATFSTNVKYSNGSEIPDEASYKMVANGYTFEMGGKRVPAEAKSSFTYEGKNIIEFNTGSTANIDELLKEDALNKYLGTANGLITIADNFVIVTNTNNEGLANDIEALKKSLTYPEDYDSPTYNTDLNNYNKKYSEGMVLAYNKNAKLILVSKKDGTKIADVIQKSVKGDSNGSEQEYEEVLFLKFNDTTEVEMSAYFSTGFDALNTKFQNFLTGFERK